jgi:hypothetical protein
MASNYWIKLYHEILHDRKMATLSDHLYRRVIELFLLAGETDQDGALPEIADIAWILRADESALLDDLRALAKVGITTDTNNGWIVTNFAERQAPSDPEERVRRHRERKAKDAYYSSEQPAPEQAEQPTVEPVTEQVTEPAEPCNEVVTNRYSSVTVAVTNPSQIRLDKIRLDKEEIRTEPAREIPATRPAEPAKVQPVQPLQAYSFKEPEGVTASGGSSKPPDIRNQCAAAIDYWIQVGKRRGMHDDDKYQIGAMVKSYGWERVKAAMDAEPMGALWNIQKRLMTPQPAEPVTVTA